MPLPLRPQQRGQRRMGAGARPSQQIQAPGSNMQLPQGPGAQIYPGTGGPPPPATPSGPRGGGGGSNAGALIARGGENVAAGIRAGTQRKFVEQRDLKQRQHEKDMLKLRENLGKRREAQELRATEHSRAVGLLAEIHAGIADGSLPLNAETDQLLKAAGDRVMGTYRRLPTEGDLWAGVEPGVVPPGMEGMPRSSDIDRVVGTPDARADSTMAMHTYLSAKRQGAIKLASTEQLNGMMKQLWNITDAKALPGQRMQEKIFRSLGFRGEFDKDTSIPMFMLQGAKEGDPAALTALRGLAAGGESGRTSLSEGFTTITQIKERLAGKIEAGELPSLNSWDDIAATLPVDSIFGRHKTTLQSGEDIVLNASPEELTVMGVWSEGYYQMLSGLRGEILGNEDLSDDQKETWMQAINGRMQQALAMAQTGYNQSNSYRDSSIPQYARKFTKELEAQLLTGEIDLEGHLETREDLRMISELMVTDTPFEEWGPRMKEAGQEDLYQMWEKGIEKEMDPFRIPLHGLAHYRTPADSGPAEAPGATAPPRNLDEALTAMNLDETVTLPNIVGGAENILDDMAKGLGSPAVPTSMRPTALGHGSKSLLHPSPAMASPSDTEAMDIGLEGLEPLPEGQEPSPWGMSLEELLERLQEDAARTKRKGR